MPLHFRICQQTLFFRISEACVPQWATLEHSRSRNAGADGTRTRDPRCDRPYFTSSSMSEGEQALSILGDYPSSFAFARVRFCPGIRIILEDFGTRSRAGPPQSPAPNPPASARVHGASFEQIAFATSEDEHMAAIHVLQKHHLHQRRRAMHPPTHVSHARRQPDLGPRRSAITPAVPNN
jgi:hypothetical protein